MDNTQQQLKNSLLSLISQGPFSSIHSHEKNEFKQFLFQLLRNVLVSDSVDFFEMVPLFQEVVKSLPDEGEALVIDCLFLMETMFSSQSDVLKRLGQFILVLKDNNILGVVNLIKRISPELLYDSKIMGISPKKLSGIIQRQITSEKILQKKYNLLREESEGYAKLITELNTDFIDTNDVLQHIYSLIGTFDLDPNRVGDLILDSFERNVNNLSYLELLSCFPTLNIAPLIGSKFNAYENAKIIPPSGLCEVTAILIQNNLLSLDEFFRYLSPDCDTNVVGRIKIHAYDLINEAGKVNVVSDFLKSEEERKNFKILYDTMKLNPKFGVVASLFKIGDWENAITIIQCFPELQFNSFPIVIKSLCSYMSHMMEPIYKQAVQFPQLNNTDYFNEPENVQTFKVFLSEFLEKIKILGIYLYQDTILWTKIARLLRVYVKACFKNFEQDEIEAVVTFIGEILLPAMSLNFGNPALPSEVWNLLKQFKYETRFWIYSIWENINTYPLYETMKKLVSKEIKYHWKRIPGDGSLEKVKVIDTLTHSCPSVVIKYLIEQLKHYPNFKDTIICCCKYFTSLSYDVFMYDLICDLSKSSQSQTLDDGYSISIWLKNVSVFTGAYCKEYPQTDLIPLITYLMNQLRYENHYQFYILTDIISSMTHIVPMEGESDDKINFFYGGGKELRKRGQMTLFTKESESNSRAKKGRPRDILKKNLVKSKQLFPLYYLLSQRRVMAAFDFSSSKIKVVGTICDQLQELVLTYSEYLLYHVLPKENIEFPTVKYMHDLNVDKASIFHLLRPHVAKIYDDVPFKKPAEADEIVSAETETDVVMSDKSSYLEEIDEIFETGPLTNIFMGLFWSLELNSVFVNSKNYVTHINLLKSEKPDSSELKNLEQEMANQKEEFLRLKKYLNTEAASFFGENASQDEILSCYFQKCLFPRLLFSSKDALFCSKFAYLLHFSRIENFSLRLYFDKLLSDIGAVMAVLSEDECRRLGRFLNDSFIFIHEWRKDETIFSKKYSGYTTDDLSYSEFKELCLKWESKLFRVIDTHLRSEDYVRPRNALIILQKIIQIFPKYDHYKDKLTDTMAKLLDRSESDISVTAKTYVSKIAKLELYSESMYLRDSKIKKRESRKTAEKESSVERQKRKREKDDLQDEQPVQKKRRLDDNQDETELP
eukprot:TRINITY_DN2607_c0_g1_i2.p1 TRINITY_DN2607_c0_g1~~TRINITY_DN2607_c0_g1_i2.p1  ORF type:complete len:1167 (+),score=225.16 TRINITY_DN2607_c0_g1_i2:17-3517(+)